MTDALLTEAWRPILDTSVVGSVCLILAAILVFRERSWEKKLLAEEKKTDAERMAHDATRERLLEYSEQRRKQNDDTIRALEASAIAMRANLDFQRQGNSQ